jgi:hypothetical protein
MTRPEIVCLQNNQNGYQNTGYSGVFRDRSSGYPKHQQYCNQQALVIGRRNANSPTNTKPFRCGQS